MEGFGEGFFGEGFGENFGFGFGIRRTGRDCFELGIAAGCCCCGIVGSDDFSVFNFLVGRTDLELMEVWDIVRV